MGLFGSTIDLEHRAVEILTRVPHLQTESRLVLGKEDSWYFIGWEGWNGRQAVNSKQLRWVRFFNNHDDAEEAFYAKLDEGPKLFKVAKTRNYQPGRVWKWWCEQITPKAQPATFQEVKTLVTKLYKKLHRPPPAFVQGSGSRNTFKNRKNKNGVREFVMFVQERPTIPRVLLDTLWPLYGHAYTPSFVLALMEALVRYAKFDRGEIRAQVRRYRIKVAKKTAKAQ